MGHIITVSQLKKRKYKTFGFSGEWGAFLGQPERRGSWMIWGESGQGKTRFVLQLCKYLQSFPKVKIAYNSLEEGANLTMQKAIADTEINGRNFYLLDKMNVRDLVEVQNKKKINVIVIDSLQYFVPTIESYQNLKEQFNNILLIYISHADGKNPKGGVADFIRYDADVKMQVRGYRAFPSSVRFGNNQNYYTIYEKGANEYWG